MDAQVAKNLTRADVVRLLSRQVLEDRETEMVGAADAVSKARDAFKAEVSDTVLYHYADLLGDMATTTTTVDNLSSGDFQVRVDYELYDDELDSPRGVLTALVTDGPAGGRTFSIRIPVPVEGKLADLRQAWISATHHANAAVIASRKLSEIAKDARVQVIQEALESTEAGRKVLALLPDVRAEVGRQLCD